MAVSCPPHTSEVCTINTSGFPRSPWQNPYVERLIGTLRRDYLDHVLILGERHLRRVLTLYSLYYNETCTHFGLS
ncbi:MAG: integrase core domain-containing protein [Burkholderiales bacterium]